MPSMDAHAQPCVTLLCGRCPTRRVLCHLRLWPEWLPYTPDPVVRTEETGHRRRRPSVSRAPSPSWEPGEFAAVRRRCRLGHAFVLYQEKLVPAYRQAVASGRRELVAGVDL
jgi:hypothetical protein